MDVPTEQEIEDRLAERPDLLEQFRAGDMRVLAELVEVGTGARVEQQEIRTAAFQQ